MKIPRSLQSVFNRVALIGSLSLSVTLGGCATPLLREWEGMEKRDHAVMHSADNKKRMAEFLSTFEDLRTKPLIEKITAVDARVDAYITYTDDIKVFGRFEYWATPLEIIAKKKGDCEDYAILKYAVLTHLDVPETRLRLMTVGDSALSVNHAILIVDTRKDDICRIHPLDDALKTQKNLDGIFIIENDYQGKMIPLKDSGYYAFGIMSKETRINALHTGHKRRAF